ncbi:MAG: hypothetical protein Q8O59_00160 [bacterium]|nr:hypothetical protein [bacterium]
MIISKFTGMPVAEINAQTIIPRRLQENIIEQVMISTGRYLPLSCEEGLMVCQIVEEVIKGSTKK